MLLAMDTPSRAASHLILHPPSVLSLGVTHGPSQGPGLGDRNPPGPAMPHWAWDPGLELVALTCKGSLEINGKTSILPAVSPSDAAGCPRQVLCSPACLKIPFFAVSTSNRRVPAQQADTPAAREGPEIDLGSAGGRQHGQAGSGAPGSRQPKDSKHKSGSSNCPRVGVIHGASGWCRLEGKAKKPLPGQGGDLRDNCGNAQATCTGRNQSCWERSRKRMERPVYLVPNWKSTLSHLQLSEHHAAGARRATLLHSPLHPTTSPPRCSSTHTHTPNPPWHGRPLGRGWDCRERPVQQRVPGREVGKRAAWPSSVGASGSPGLALKEVGRTLGAIAVTRGSRVHDIGMQEALWMLAPPDSVGSPSEASWPLGTLCAVHIPAHLPTDMPRHVWASGRHLRPKTHWSPEALEAGIPGCPVLWAQLRCICHGIAGCPPC